MAQQLRNLAIQSEGAELGIPTHIISQALPLLALLYTQEAHVCKLQVQSLCLSLSLTLSLSHAHTHTYAHAHAHMHTHRELL